MGDAKVVGAGVGLWVWCVVDGVRLGDEGRADGVCAL